MWHALFREFFYALVDEQSKIVWAMLLLKRWWQAKSVKYEMYHTVRSRAGPSQASEA